MKAKDILSHRESCADCRHILKFLNGCASFAWIYKDMAVLIVPNQKQPCKSVIVVDRYPT